MRLTLSVPLVISSTLLSSANLSAAEDPRDISGVWQAIATVPAFDPAAVPKLTPEGEVMVADFSARFPNTLDPAAFCVPAGMPGMMTAPGAQLEVLQSFNRIALLGADGSVRRIFIGDERAFPETTEPTRAGYSNAHWENDTLVVETRFVDEVLGGRWPRTAATVIHERITKQRRERATLPADAAQPDAAHEDNAVLEVNLTVTDEALYREPQMLTIFYQHLAAEALPESSCTTQLWQQALDAANQ